jgi:hypothetical protein
MLSVLIKYVVFEKKVKYYTLFCIQRYRGKPEPKDAWTIVRMEGRFELIPSSEDNFDILDPIISKDVNTIIIVDVNVNASLFMYISLIVKVV